MPGRDGTGPLGQGPMTGKGMGCCAIEAPANAALPGQGLEMGFGRGGAGRSLAGGGRGRRNCYWATGVPGWMRYGQAAPVRPDVSGFENQALKNQVEALQSELDFIKKRLSEMESGAGEAR